MKDLTEKKISSETIFDGLIMNIERHRVQLPNGKPGVRELMRHVGAVCVVPLTDDGKVIMERQFRYPIGRTVLEIPAGKLDSPDEDRLEAAKRELAEETGYTAERWTDLGLYIPAPAYSDEEISVFLAEGLCAGERHLDADEFIEVEEIPLKKLESMIYDGEIADGKTQVAILKASEIVKNRE